MRVCVRVLARILLCVCMCARVRVRATDDICEQLQ